MHNSYVGDVSRYGGQRHNKDADGKTTRLNHDTDFDPSEVQTNGQGDVFRMPLLERKACFGRPERHLRGLFSGRPYIDDDGDQRITETTCTRCEVRSPGVFAACHDLSIERIKSNAEIEEAANRWLDAIQPPFGRICFRNSLGQLWANYLSTIERHGGWTTVNDDQVKVAQVINAAQKRKQRAMDAKARRLRDKIARRGATAAVTPEIEAALNAERLVRAEGLKKLRSFQGKAPRDMLRFTALTDESCDRIANVWWARELLVRLKGEAKGREIAELLRLRGKSTLSQGTLKAHVSRDLKRIRDYEQDMPGGPLWGKWEYEPSPAATPVGNTP